MDYSGLSLAGAKVKMVLFLLMAGDRNERFELFNMNDMPRHPFLNQPSACFISP
jgi:hypothetical protein